MQFSPASTVVLVGIPSLAALVSGLFVLGVAVAERALGKGRRAGLGRAALCAIGVGVWTSISWLLAERGVLSRFEAHPPPLLVLLLATLVGGVLLGRSPLGGRLARGLPLWALVGFEAFRLPLELVLHRAARDGTMPIEMSFSGYNFDIVSGAAAALVALWLVRSARPSLLALRVTALWNVLGLALLGNIVAIAIAATPVFHAFGPAHLNVWITHTPFVLLPSILVLAALVGHVIVFRKLQQLRGEAAAASNRPAANLLNASDKGSADHHRLGTAAAK
jgi:hypothetical protein